LPAHAWGQALSQPGVVQQGTMQQGATQQSGTIQGRSGTIQGQSVPVLSNAAAQQAAVQQNTLLNPGYDQLQQGVAIPQRPANRLRQFGVQLTGAAIYDTNATSSSAQRAAASGLSQKDFRFPFGVNLDIFVPAGPNQFSLSGLVGYDYNVRNTQRNRENISLNAGFQRSLHACATSLGAHFQRASTPLGNTSQFILPVSNVETRTGVDGSLSCGNVSGIKPFLSASYSNGSNSDPIRQISDYTRTSYGGGFTFGQPSFIEFGLIASIDDTGYPNRAGLVLANGFKATNIGFTIDRAAARHLRARVQLNYTSVKNHGPGQSFSGISGQGNVTFIPGGRFTFTASFSRSASPSLSTNSDYNLTTGVGLSVSAAISPKTDVALGASLQDRKYFAAVYNPVHPLTNDSLRTINATIHHQLTPRLNLNATATRNSRRANDPFYNFSGMLFALHASLSL
jgi:hypothetical protein